MNATHRASFHISDKVLGVMATAGLAAVLALAILASGEAAIYGLFAILGYWMFIQRPVLGLYITTALLLLSGSATLIGDLRLQVPVTCAKVFGSAAMAAWLTHVIVRRERIVFTAAMGVLLAFFAWAGLGIAMSPTWRLQWPEWIRLGTLVAYFFLAVNVLNTPKRIHYFVILILVCGLIMASFAIAQYFISGLQLEVSTALADIGVRAEGAYVDTDSGVAAVRVSGGAGHSNWLAMVILVIMPLNAYWFMTAERPVVKGIALLTVLLEVIALILTFTRTGFLVGLIVLALLALRNLVRFTPLRISLVACSLFLGFFALPDAYKARVLDFSQYTQSDSVDNRWDLQKAAVNLTARNPVWGVGLGGYGPHLLQENTRVSRTMQWFVKEHNWPPQFIGTHNMYLQLASETGLVGLGLLLVFFALIWRDLHRSNRALAAMNDRRGMALTSTVEVGLIAFLVCAVFLHALQQKIWWMVAAMAAVAPLYQVTVARSKSAPAPRLEAGTPPPAAPSGGNEEAPPRVEPEGSVIYL